MANTQSVAFKKQYEAAFRLLVQQEASKFENKVWVYPMSANKAYVNFVGNLNIAKRLSQNAQTIYQDAPHTKRRIIAETWDVPAILIDEPDQVRMIADPASIYARAQRAAIKRKLDQQLMAAAIGNAYSADEDEAETAVALGAGQQITEAGTVGLTLQKITLCLEKFHTNDVDPDVEKWMAISPKGLTDLLNEPELSIAEQNALRMVNEGKVEFVRGFRMVLSNQLPLATNIRSNVAWIREGLCLGMIYDVKARAEENMNFNYSTQVWASIDFGCTRMQEKLVVEVQSYEA
jgi:hypothetical protein